MGRSLVKSSINWILAVLVWTIYYAPSRFPATPSPSLSAFMAVPTASAGGNEVTGALTEEAREKFFPVEMATLARGNLSVVFRDNSRSPQFLSGIASLTNIEDGKGFDAFDPDTIGASAGLNFEHIISGHSNPANPFSPRHGRYTLYRLNDRNSVVLVRNREDCPWKVSSSCRYTLTKPHYIDVDFHCETHEPGLFGPRGYAILFFADYMNDVAEVPIHFLGIDRPGGTEKWIAGDAPNTHPDWNHGGTYRNLLAEDLLYDADHNFKLNVWSYDYPRFTKPFYYGLTTRNMVFLIMFNKAWTDEDEIRFSLFKFKLPQLQRPAWDFQYVIHRVAQGKDYGFKARLVWKKFVSPEDCLQEYKRWLTVLHKEQRRDAGAENSTN